MQCDVEQSKCGTSGQSIRQTVYPWFLSNVISSIELFFGLIQMLRNRAIKKLYSFTCNILLT